VRSGELVLRPPASASAGWAATVAQRARTARVGGAGAWQWLGLLGAGVCVGLFAVAAVALPQRWSVLAIAAAVAALLAVLVGSLERVLLGAAVLDLALPIGHHFGWQEAQAQLGALGGLDVSVTTIAIIGLYGLWIARAVVHRDQGLPKPLWSRPLALYLGLAMLSLTVATDRSLSAFELVMLVQTFLLYVYVATWVRTRKDVQFLIAALLAALLFEGLLTIALHHSGRNLDLGGAVSTRIDTGTLGGAQQSRVGGTVGSPNTEAAFLTLLLAPALAVFLTRLPARFKYLAGAAFVAGAIALLFTLSRGGWVAFAISLTTVLLVAAAKGWVSTWKLAGIAVALVILVFPFRTMVVERITGNDNNSASGRVQLIYMANQIIHHSPLLGIGANNYAAVLPQYLTPAFSRAWIYTVHNKYLLIWAENGVFALAAFVAFLLATIGKGLRSVRRSDDLLAPLALGLSAAVLGQCFHMFFDVFHSRQQVQSLWLVAALIAAIDGILRRERGRAAARAPSESTGAFFRP
jgi:putative inorganic carbon (HCO3(-)) transporter